MGCGKKTEPIDTATNLATLEMAGTHWQLTVDDQGNAVWTAARSAGAEGLDTDRARDLKLSGGRQRAGHRPDGMREPGPGQLLGLRPLLGPGGDQELPHGVGRGFPEGPNGGEFPPRLGDARGLMTLNPKLLDIRVVKGWATGSRQLGGARSELGCVSHPTKRSPPVVYKP